MQLTILFLWKKYNLPKEIAKEIDEWVLGDIKSHQTKFASVLGEMMYNFELNWYLDVTVENRVDEVKIEGQNLDLRMIWLEELKHRNGYTTYLGGDFGSAKYFVNGKDYIAIYHKHRTHLYDEDCFSVIHTLLNVTMVGG